MKTYATLTSLSLCVEKIIIIQAMKGLPKDFKNRCVFGNKIETNLLRHKDAFQLKDICARSLCPNSEASCFN